MKRTIFLRVPVIGPSLSKLWPMQIILQVIRLKFLLEHDVESNNDKEADSEPKGE